jgi:hypothetical protein
LTWCAVCCIKRSRSSARGGGGLRGARRRCAQCPCVAAKRDCGAGCGHQKGEAIAGSRKRKPCACCNFPAGRVAAKKQKQATHDVSGRRLGGGRGSPAEDGGGEGEGEGGAIKLSFVRTLVTAICAQSGRPRRPPR